MKKNLLITLGCSMTEGVGCYDESINPDKKLYFDLPKKFKNQTIERFHKLGWPNRVGKKLGYDKVLNLGAGGTSNSLHLKLFVDKVIPNLGNLKENYNISVIWMMTDPTRFSFYTPSAIKFFLPAQTAEGLALSKLEEAYIKTMPEFKIGPAREQVHLIKLAEYMFKSLEIPIAFTSWNPSFKTVYKLYTSGNFISPSFENQTYSYKKNERSTIVGCNHPNEKGYEVIAENIVKLLKKYRPEFLPNNLNSDSEFSWEWDGSIEYNPLKGSQIL